MQYRIVEGAHGRTDACLAPKNAIVRARAMKGSTAYAGEVVDRRTFFRRNVLIFQPYVT